jgi:prepilin-type processing-associated H-X9-DG protein
MYATSMNDNRLPWGAITYKTADKNTDWAIVLQNFLTKSGGPNYQDTDIDKKDTGFFRCPSASGEGFRHYSAHPTLMPWWGEPTAVSIGSWYTMDGYSFNKNGPYKLNMIKRSSEVMLIGDSNLILDKGRNAIKGIGENALPVMQNLHQSAIYWQGLFAGVANAPSPNSTINFYSTQNRDWFTYNYNGGQTDGHPRFRHQGNTAMNVLFADGHADVLRARMNKTTNTILSTGDLKARNVFVDPPGRWQK